jgi:hypothetical protein
MMTRGKRRRGVFAYFLDLKAPRFVTGYSALEADVRSTPEVALFDSESISPLP